MSLDRPKTRIIATLGPASARKETIAALYRAGASVFRLNFSHGTHEQHKSVYDAIRAVEADVGRPIAVMADLQGPKLRVGTFKGTSARISYNSTFILDSDPTPGDENRVFLPHPEILEALAPGHRLLIDDGRLRLDVVSVSPGKAETKVVVPGIISDRKGVSLPDTVIKTTALTEKDHRDLAFALSLNVDWVALSFVQRPEDLDEARAIIGNQALLLAKIEKPSAISQIEAIIERSDGVMVARGDLGVELPPEDVPPLQKRIVRLSRLIGRPVVVATQMLESMTSAAVPTRAEASDVANAVYDGADAVMLSAETASGNHPVPAVMMMRRIIDKVEADPLWKTIVAIEEPYDGAIDVPEAIGRAAADIGTAVGADAIACFTTSGKTAIRVARVRPSVPILCLAPTMSVCRRTMMVYGVTAALSRDVTTFEDVVAQAIELATLIGAAESGGRVVITAGIPFGKLGSTNTLRVAVVA